MALHGLQPAQAHHSRQQGGWGQEALRAVRGGQGRWGHGVSKRNDTWMPLYIGDYLADTSRLSTEQHGAYLLLLMDYWRNGPPLDDDEELASITKLPLPQWRKHAAKLRSFFEAVNGRLVQKRADEERGKAGLVSSKRSQAGKAGAASRWGKADGKGDGKPIANAMANAWQNDGPSQSQSNTQKNQGGDDPTEGGAAGSFPPTLAEADDPPPAPSLAGRACIAMRGANVHDVNPAHPDLLRLLAAGVTPEEIGSTAAECAAKGKARFAYVLATIERRLDEAAARPPTAAAVPADPMAWAESRSQVADMGCRLGLGPFEELNRATGHANSWQAYRTRVIAAWRAQHQPQGAAA